MLFSFSLGFVVDFFNINIDDGSGVNILGFQLSGNRLVILTGVLRVCDSSLFSNIAASRAQFFLEVESSIPSRVIPSLTFRELVGSFCDIVGHSYFRCDSIGRQLYCILLHYRALFSTY
jgi:hypothetical protein